MDVQRSFHQFGQTKIDEGSGSGEKGKPDEKTSLEAESKPDLKMKPGVDSEFEGGVEPKGTMNLKAESGSGEEVMSDGNAKPEAESGFEGNTNPERESEVETKSKEKTKPEKPQTTPRVLIKTDIVVIGAGQAGLSSAYHLNRLGLEPGRGFVVLDQSESAGGAWQHRWPSLTLSTVNRIHDLPGLGLAEAVDVSNQNVQANSVVPEYYDIYEKTFNLPVYRPVNVMAVCDRGDRFTVESDGPHFSAWGIINATGTWESPHIPEYPGADRFEGRQMHTKDYHTAEELAGNHVLIVGGGISAIQLMEEISQVTRTSWVTRRPPSFRKGPFTLEDGRAAVALVEERVRKGLPPRSVVSVTGLPVTPAIEEMRKRGVLDRKPMFSEITEEGVRWADGTTLKVDVILWCTGFRSSLDHLAPLMLRNENGGISMTGRLATQVKKDPRIHLVGYGSSASTIGANRAGGAAARELTAFLGLR